jgi:hypothetical protein
MDEKVIDCYITGGMGRYMDCKNKEKQKRKCGAEPRLCSIVSCGLEALSLGFPSLGSTLRRWVPPFIVRHYPSSLGSTLRRWVLPFVVLLRVVVDTNVVVDVWYRRRRWGPFSLGRSQPLRWEL